MKLKKHERYEIFWVDTFGYNGWYNEKEIDEKTKQQLESHIGYLVKETKDYIILTMGRDYNEDFAPYNSPKWIPRGFIKKIIKLQNNAIKKRKKEHRKKYKRA